MDDDAFDRPPRLRHTWLVVASVVVGVAALVGTVALVAKAGSTSHPTISRDDFIAQLVDGGVSSDVAGCMADRQNGEFPADVNESTGAEGFMLDFMQCSGASAATATCLIGAMQPIVGESFTFSDLVAAQSTIEPTERKSLLRAGMVCQGVPADLADCVMVGIEREFGAEVFQRETLDFSEGEQQRIDAIGQQCVDGGVP